MSDGRALVDAAADGGHDAVDDATERGLVGEVDVGLLEQTAALHPHTGGVVAHDLGDVGVLEQRGAAALLAHLAVLQHVGAVGDLQRLADVLLHQHHAHALGVDLLHLLEDPLGRTLPDEVAKLRFGRER